MEYWKKIKKKSWLFGDSEYWEPQFEERGGMEKIYDSKSHSYKATVCSRCQSIANIGIKDGKAFLYCKKCMSLLEK